MASTRVGEEPARLALMSLAEAFGVADDALDGFLNLAMDGRLYLDQGRAVFVLREPITLGDDSTVQEVRLREPNAGDYVEYSKGMSVTVKDGATEINAVMMTNRAIRAVARLGDVKGGEAIVKRFTVKDVRTLGEVCDALGFFE